MNLRIARHTSVELAPMPIPPPVLIQVALLLYSLI